MPVKSTSLGTPPNAELRVGGLTRLTSIDFPGRLAAVVFCQGCPWRCGYCQNPDLLDASGPTARDWSSVLGFLRTRQGLLDGVVFSGGEPTLQSALVPALADARALGFETALHTGGMYPERLATVLPLLDWVGLDIKAPPTYYDAITGTPGSGVRAFASLDLLLDAQSAYECRTTWNPSLFSESELFAMARDLCARGVRHWALQECRTRGAPAWALTADQIQELGTGFERFTLRLSKTFLT